MEIVRGRFLVPLAWCVLLLASAGCGPAFNTRLMPLHLPETCPATLEDALAPVNTDPTGATESQLSCALQAVRDMRPPHAAESLEASKICAILAEACPETEEGTKRRHALAWEGVKWAEHAMATGAYIDTASSYYSSINMGLAVSDTIVAAVKNLGNLHRNIERAVSMDPDIDEGGPMRTLGYLLIRAPAWPTGIGDPDRGLILLEQAVTLYPAYPPNQLIRARGVWEAEEDEEVAMFHAREALDLLRTHDFGIRQQSWERALRRLISDIAGEDTAEEMMSVLDQGAAPAN